MGWGGVAQRSQKFEGCPSRFLRTNRASSIREHTRGMFRGTQTYRVSALWMQRSGPPPPPSPALPARRVHRARWLAGALRCRCSHLFIIKFRVYPATDARLNFYPPNVYTRGRASAYTAEENARGRRKSETAPPEKGRANKGLRRTRTGVGTTRTRAHAYKYVYILLIEDRFCRHPLPRTGFQGEGGVGG